MAHLITPDHECKGCLHCLIDCSKLPPDTKLDDDEVINKALKCGHPDVEEKERDCPPTGRRKDCPIEQGISAKMFKRSVETSQAIEEGSS